MAIRPYRTANAGRNAVRSLLIRQAVPICPDALGWPNGSEEARCGLAYPKKATAGETRVAATPETVKKLRAAGLPSRSKTGAGSGAHFTDAAYREAGADIVEHAQALGADVVFKIHKPTPQEIRHP